MTWLTRASGLADAELPLITGHAGRRWPCPSTSPATVTDLAQRYLEAMRKGTCEPERRPRGQARRIHADALAAVVRSLIWPAGTCRGCPARGRPNRALEPRE